YGWLKGMDIEDTIKLGMINSRKTIETSYTVRQDLDEHQLLKNLEEMKQYLSITDEVQRALDENKPVVALESTIISHGMPYPQNVEMAKEVEQIVRENGAVPATIAIIDGKIKIGLNDEELEIMGNTEDIAKVSRRDMAQVVAT